MKKPLGFTSHGVIGLAPSIGYLVTLIGGIAVATVGCHERGALIDSSASGSAPSAYQPAVVTAAAEPGEGVKEAAPLQPRATATQASETGVVTPRPAASAPALQAADVKVKRFIVTPGVQDREPLPTGETLTLGEPVYAFAELSSSSGSAAGIEIVFEHESGRKVGYIKLDVPADKARWRTWGHSRGVNQPGIWSAVLLGPDQAELARVAFDVAMSPPSVGSPAITEAPEASADHAALNKRVAAADVPNAIVSADPSLARSAQ